MTALRLLYHLVRADFRERVRRSSFLVMLAVTLWLGYLLVPPADAGYVAGILPHDRRIDVQWFLRGAYNSAWIGNMVALLTSLLLSLPGFYLVRSAVERDRRSGVGEILATTPLSKPFYTLGKWLGNLALLGTMVGALAAAALAMQLIGGEVVRVDLWALLLPFFLIALPTMAFVAALSVLFETIPWLRGGVGNAAYFAVWTAAMAVSAQVDLFGMNVVVPHVEATAQAAHPDHLLSSSIEINWIEGAVETFTWEGIRWTLPLVLQRLSWVAVALGVALVAALPFDRFDPARQRLARPRTSIPEESAEVRPPSAGGVPVSVAGLDAGMPRYRFWRLFLAEMRLTWKAMPRWWFAVALGLALVGLLCSADVSRRYVLPLSWFWPLLLWSAMGVREAQHGTGNLVFSTAHPLRRQFPAMWLAGVTVSVLTGMGVALRLVLAGQWTGLMGWAVGASFVPSLALALGIWSGSSRPFEAVYMVLWYVGPLNGLSALDYMGALRQSTNAGVHWRYLIVTVVLLPLAALGRWRQIRTLGGVR